jgi:hypothetical protein
MELGRSGRSMMMRAPAAERSELRRHRQQIGKSAARIRLPKLRRAERHRRLGGRRRFSFYEMMKLGRWGDERQRQVRGVGFRSRMLRTPRRLRSRPQRTSVV